MSDNRQTENSLEPLRKRYRSAGLAKMAPARPRLQMAAHSSDSIVIDEKPNITGEFPITLHGQQAVTSYVMTSTGQMMLPSGGHVPGILRRPINAGLQKGSAPPGPGQYIAVQRHPMARDGQYLMSMAKSAMSTPLPIPPPVQPKLEIVDAESVETIKMTAFVPITCTYNDITLNQSEILSNLCRYLVSMYRPMTNAVMFRLLLVQGTKALHVDIHQSTFHDFMMKLLIKLMACNTLPFTLEVKDAPLDPSAGPRKAINVQDCEVAKWVFHIANRLRSPVKPDPDMLDTKLNVRFTLRLGLLAIEMEPMDDRKRSAQLQIRPLQPEMVPVEAQRKKGGRRSSGQRSQRVQTNIQICPTDASDALKSTTHNPRDVLGENLRAYAETHAMTLSGYEATQATKMAALEPLVNVFSASMMQISQMANVSSISTGRPETKSVNIQTNEMSLYETDTCGKQVTQLEQTITILTNKMQAMMVLALNSFAKLELKCHEMSMSQGNSLLLRQRSSDVNVKKEAPEPFEFFGNGVPMIRHDVKRKVGSLYMRSLDNKENHAERQVKRNMTVQKNKDQQQGLPDANDSKFGNSRRPINQGLSRSGQRDSGGCFNSVPPQQREGRAIQTKSATKGRSEADEDVFKHLPETDALIKEMEKLVVDADKELIQVQRGNTSLEDDLLLSDEISQINFLDFNLQIGDILIEDDDCKKLFNPDTKLSCEEIDDMLK